jgi:hypothetical protein
MGQRAVPALQRAGRAAAIAAQRAPASSRGISGAQLGQLLSELLARTQRQAEWESLANPLQRVYPQALMEHVGHMAAEAESEEEAEAFIGALVPLATRLLPLAARAAAPALRRALPSLTRGAMAAARSLHRSPARRQLLRTMPSAIQRTVNTVATQTARGRRVTPTQARRTLSRAVYQNIASPARCQQLLRRSDTLDRRFHRMSGVPTAAAVGTRRPCGCR